MTAEDKTTLQTLEMRVRQMLELVDTLRKENKQLQDTLQDRNIEIECLNEEIEKRKHSYDTLKMARIIDVGDGDKTMVRKRINQLIREVDKCINIVKS